MAAVVRIKRRLDEDPLESLILNCKRRKTVESSTDKPEDLSAVLRLAGTSQKEEPIDTLLKRHQLTDIAKQKEQFKKHSVNISEKARANARESSKSSRYKVVNAFRKPLITEEAESLTDSSPQVTVFDVETEQISDEPSSSNGGSSNYVYDFYYTSSDDLGEANIEDFVSVCAFNDPLIFGSARDNGLDALESDDSEDSNAESYWKNDYPDEEDLESITEDDMIEAVKKLDIEEDLLSSDSGDEDLVYSKDEEDFQEMEGELDREDELRYGRMYAKFKARNKNVQTTNLANDFFYGDIDEEECHY